MKQLLNIYHIIFTKSEDFTNCSNEWKQLPTEYKKPNTVLSNISLQSTSFTRWRFFKKKLKKVWQKLDILSKTEK